MSTPPRSVPHEVGTPPTSFYSPKLGPQTEPLEERPFALAVNTQTEPQSSNPTTPSATDRPSKSWLSSLNGDVPSSLLSPAFTPPATPGTRTPAIQREPDCVKVDSTDLENGGVGRKRPKLLETLPEVTCVVRARIPTTTGTEMYLHLYTNNVDQKEHLAIVFGQQIRSRSLDAPREGETEMDRMIRGAYTGRLYPGRTSSSVPTSAAQAAPEPDLTTSPYVRIHSECYTGETAWSTRCDCGEQLNEAARILSLPSSSPTGGVIIYLRQEGRGIGLGEKLKAYNLQDLGNDTVEANLLLRHPADARSYGLATAMLVDLGLSGDRGIRLLTNNPDKIRAVEGPGREVIVKERVAMVPLTWRGAKGVAGVEFAGYLKTKVSTQHERQANNSQIEKMGHMLSMG
jgi:GTP cyclohydrolase II